MHPARKTVKQFPLYGIYPEIFEELTIVFKKFGNKSQNSREFLPSFSGKCLLGFYKNSANILKPQI
jgi:hypothetical protein